MKSLARVHESQTQDFSPAESGAVVERAFSVNQRAERDSARQSGQSQSCQLVFENPSDVLLSLVL